jgi:hypothetical protein
MTRDGITLPILRCDYKECYMRAYLQSDETIVLQRMKYYVQGVILNCWNENTNSDVYYLKLLQPEPETHLFTGL